VGLDIGFVQTPGMDDRAYLEVTNSGADKLAINDRSNNVGVFCGNAVDANDLVTITS